MCPSSRGTVEDAPHRGPGVLPRPVDAFSGADSAGETNRLQLAAPAPPRLPRTGGFGSCVLVCVPGGIGAGQGERGGRRGKGREREERRGEGARGETGGRSERRDGGKGGSTSRIPQVSLVMCPSSRGTVEDSPHRGPAVLPRPVDAFSGADSAGETNRLQLAAPAPPPPPPDRWFWFMCACLCSGRNRSGPGGEGREERKGEGARGLGGGIPPSLGPHRPNGGTTPEGTLGRRTASGPGGEPPPHGCRPLSERSRLTDIVCSCGPPPPDPRSQCTEGSPLASKSL